MDIRWEGTVPGAFEGYAGGRVYRLSDGSRWRQECLTAESTCREDPGARLLWDPSLGRMLLDVEGTSAVVWVRPDRSGMGSIGHGAY